MNNNYLNLSQTETLFADLGTAVNPVSFQVNVVYSGRTINVVFLCQSSLCKVDHCAYKVYGASHAIYDFIDPRDSSRDNFRLYISHSSSDLQTQINPVRAIFSERT